MDVFFQDCISLTLVEYRHVPYRIQLFDSGLKFACGKYTQYELNIRSAGDNVCGFISHIENRGRLTNLIVLGCGKCDKTSQPDFENFRDHIILRLRYCDGCT